MRARSIGGLAGFTLVAGAVTWIGADELDLPARAFTTLLVGVLPPLLIAQAKIPESDLAELPVAPVYVSSMLLIWAIGLGALWAGRASAFGWAELGLAGFALPEVLLWTGIVTLAALAFAALGRALGVRESPLVEWLLPVTARERALFVLLSISAGIGEELAYRAFLIPALRYTTGSTFLAVVISSAAFGMMHSYQSATGALRAAALGALLSVPLLVTGSIYASMAAHAVFDVVAGVLLADWLLRRDGRETAVPRQKH